MVTGGTGATTSVELLHINGTKLCSLPNLPVARYQHSQTGIVFDNFDIDVCANYGHLALRPYGLRAAIHRYYDIGKFTLKL